jgi:oligosaccharyltransferase complex subunit beta
LRIDRGFELTFESPRDSSLSLFTLGERSYDHIILLPPTSKAYGDTLNPKTLLDFVNADGNVLLALTGEKATPSAINSLLLEFDITLPAERTSVVVDHFNYDTTSASESHDVVVIDPPGKGIRPDVKNFFGGELPVAVPRAVGQVLGNNSPLLVPILRAPGSSYTYNPKDKEVDSVEDSDLFATGSQISLVSALQARNSARFTVLGSAEMLEDRWFDAKVKLPEGKSTKTGNRQFAKQVTGWTFKELGVLKVGELNHHLTSDPAVVGNETAEINPKIYRIKNDVVSLSFIIQTFLILQSFTVEISEYDQTHLVPFIPPISDDVQLEFTMLSPFHRLSLKPLWQTPNSTMFATQFTLPDQHGIFNFRVNYKRPFFTNVDEKRQVTVRHFAHDEWPRSFDISGAWTWIAGIGVTVVGWLGFVALWLWSAPVKAKGGVKKTQ